MRSGTLAPEEHALRVGGNVDQLQGLFKGQKTVASLLTAAGFDPTQIRQGRFFASQWAWSDGHIVVASVWLDELDAQGDQLEVEFADPSARTDLKGMRRSRAAQRFELLLAAANATVRTIVQQRAVTQQGTPSQAQKRALDPAAWEVRAEPGKVLLRRLEAPDTGAALGDGWTDEELHAAVVSYLDMQSKMKDGVSVVKKHYYTQLAQQFDRTVKSFEFRMQNISYVLALKGREWIRGLPPARNVGSNVATKIEEFLGLHETTLAGQAATFEVRVAEAARKLKSKPTGSLSPTAVQAVGLQFVRDPEVKAWVLRLANGICECCSQPAPFNSVNGPFLEVHHVQRLADKGADTVENAIAICPNCHRRLHYAVDAASLIAALYQLIPRLRMLERQHPGV